ncbi:MAG TPA: C-GCAxxG-C-C family protein [Patescibacteria group bacterium]|nr:C-GCAxxG-C-C family protein [Patescibacteria group bacterium]
MLIRGSKEEILERVIKKAGDNFELSVNCAQSPLAALHEVFNLIGENEVVIKAATFMPGIVSRRETCGAVIGGLMALGLAFGKDKLYDPTLNTPEGMEMLFKFKEKAWRFAESFKKEFGSTMCGDIRPQIMGPEYRNYNGMDPKERERFLADGGAKKCRVPPETAARIAASIIMEDY